VNESLKPEKLIMWMHGPEKDEIQEAIDITKDRKINPIMSLK
jgi:hypothetical protein